MPFIQIREAKIHYRVFGESGPGLTHITGGRRGRNELIPCTEKITDKGFTVCLHDRRKPGAPDVIMSCQDCDSEIWADGLCVCVD